MAVEVYALDVVGWSPPELELDVRCAAGTYVRVLARDLGDTLGTGAHLLTVRATDEFGQSHVARRLLEVTER